MRNFAAEIPLPVTEGAFGAKVGKGRGQVTGAGDKLDNSCT